VFAVVLGVLWIVAFVNAFNFMDGIDGIAGAQALVAGLGWTALGAALGDGAVRALGIVIAGSAAGFLLLNWSPARIFMGDGGSSFLGYLLAGVPLAAQDTLGVAVPAFFIVWPFLFDTAVTLVRRAARGENLMQAHRNHLYQRLTQSGWTHARVASLYGGLSAWGAVVGWWALAVENSARGWFLASASVAVLAACLWTIVERRAISRSSA
jgi:UDP-N-acetylmuramyl pentapeptide phosphotransferase/UDP-N-acetylglucosamine-1-phosphate transferase